MNGVEPLLERRNRLHGALALRGRLERDVVVDVLENSLAKRLCDRLLDRL